MRSQLRLRVLLPVALVALLALGFGAFAFSGTPTEESDPAPLARPGGGPDGESDSRLTRKQWARQANAICRELNVEVEKLGAPQTPEEVKQLLPDTLALADKSLVDLKALVPPKRDAARVKRMLKFFGGFVKVETKASEALAQGDIEHFIDLNAFAFSLNDVGSKIARRLGARACGKGSTADSALGRELKRHRVVVAVLHMPGSSVDELAVLEARAGAAEVRAGFVALDVTDTRSIARLASQYDVRDAPAILIFARWRGAVTVLDGYADRETVAQAAENAGL